MYLLIRAFLLTASPLPLPAQHTDNEQRAPQCDTHYQHLNSITDAVSTLPSYYVFRSRLQTRPEFPFKSSYKLSSSEQHIILPEFPFYPCTCLYTLLYFIFFQIHLFSLFFLDGVQ